MIRKQLRRLRHYLPVLGLARPDRRRGGGPAAVHLQPQISLQQQQLRRHRARPTHARSRPAETIRNLLTRGHSQCQLIPSAIRRRLKVLALFHRLRWEVKSSRTQRATPPSPPPLASETILRRKPTR